MTKNKMTIAAIKRTEEIMVVGFLLDTGSRIRTGLFGDTKKYSLLYLNQVKKCGYRQTRNQINYDVLL